ncbi:hypothetical protein ACHAPQ_010018 [Fusarium lateritium]
MDLNYDSKVGHDADVATQSITAQPTWTYDEEKAVVRKLDMTLMPLLVLGFYALQLDRSNISNALTDTLTTDLNITKDDVNLGDQLMTVGIIIAEIPSNIILQKVRPNLADGPSTHLGDHCFGTSLGYRYTLFLRHSVPAGTL